jgi:hypothetical protein
MFNYVAVLSKVWSDTEETICKTQKDFTAGVNDKDAGEVH